ncbi:unnamed protein product, partial [Pylaiella littoralis]
NQFAPFRDSTLPESRAEYKKAPRERAKSGLRMSAGDEILRFQAGSSTYDFSYGSAVSADGSFYVAGITYGPFDGVASIVGNADMVVAKFDSDGNFLWSWQDGSEEGDGLVCAVATDDGGVVVGGSTGDTYNGVASEGLDDFVALKLDSDGNVEWTWQQDGTDEEDYMQTCTLTADGNVVLAGYTNGEWLGSKPGTSAIAAVKLDITDGSVVWEYQAGVTTYFVSAWGAAGRSDGSVVLVGRTEGVWGDEQIGTTDFVAVALDEDGGELWRWQDGYEFSYSTIRDVAALADDSLVLVGSTAGDYGGTNAGDTDFVIVKLTAGGVLDWTWQHGTPYEEDFEGVMTGIDGTSVIIGGYTFGSWVETNLDAEGADQDIVGMSLDGDGTLRWTYQAGTTESNDCTSVAVTPDGAALLVGWTDNEFLEDASTNYYTDFAGVMIETGGPNPTESTTFSFAPSEAPLTPPGPTPAPQPVVTSPFSCGATESFQITSDGLPEIEGCFQATDESFSNLGSNLEVWTISGDTSYDQVAVVANSADENNQENTPYSVAYISDDDDATTVYCFSNENAITVHPSDATWQCKMCGTGTFIEVSDGSTSFDCGCSPTSASTSSSSVPLAPVIGGTVGGLALLAIVGVFVAKRRSKQKDRDVGKNATVATAYPTLPGNAVVVTAYPASGGGNHGANAPHPEYSEPPPAYSG